MNGTQKTAAAGGSVGLTAVLVWIANVAGIDVPPDVIAGLGPVIGYLVRELTD